jgi:hypothetical protein
MFPIWLVFKGLVTVASRMCVCVLSAIFFIPACVFCLWDCPNSAFCCRRGSFVWICLLTCLLLPYLHINDYCLSHNWSYTFYTSVCLKLYPHQLSKLRHMRKEMLRPLRTVHRKLWCRDSSVGIATTYGLDDRGVGFRVPVGSRIFSSPRRPDRLWGPPSLLFNGH